MIQTTASSLSTASYALASQVKSSPKGFLVARGLGPRGETEWLVTGSYCRAKTASCAWHYGRGCEYVCCCCPDAVCVRSNLQWLGGGGVLSRASISLRRLAESDAGGVISEAMPVLRAKRARYCRNGMPKRAVGDVSSPCSQRYSAAGSDMAQPATWAWHGGTWNADDEPMNSIDRIQSATTLSVHSQETK